MLNPPTLVHCVAINNRSGSPPYDMFLPTTNDPKKDNIYADQPPGAKFGKMTCSDDDFESD